MTDMMRTRKLTTGQVVNLLARLVMAKLRIVVEKAKTDAACARLKAKMADRIQADEAFITEHKGHVFAFLLARKDAFLAKRRKTVDTEVARYGFRKCTDTVIDDPRAVLDFARENGYGDLFSETQPKISKAAVRKRIEAGEHIPGAHVDSDYEPFWDAQKGLLDQAKTGALPTA